MAVTQTVQMTRAMRLGTALVKALLRAGAPMGSLTLLSVRGRKSGKMYAIPVALVQQNEERWLVAAFGEVNWVRNLRAVGTAQLIHGRRAETIAVVELGATEAAPILQRFLRANHLVPFIPPYFSATPRSPLTDFEREAIHHPVFRVAHPT